MTRLEIVPVALPDLWDHAAEVMRLFSERHPYHGEALNGVAVHNFGLYSAPVEEAIVAHLNVNDEFVIVAEERVCQERPEFTNGHAEIIA